MITSILDMFEQTVAQFPDKVAFEDLNHSISFADLHQKARKIGTIIARTIKPRMPVIIYMEKSATNIAAFLGAAYAGDFYVPIDKDMPYERVKMIMECLHPGLIICEEKTRETASRFAHNVPLIEYEDALMLDVDDEQLAKIRRNCKTTDLLYVLFTSGSTGIPKGVTISHLAVIDFIEWVCDRYKIDETTIMCNQAPFYFDASVPDIFIPIKTGATVYIPPKSYYTFPKKVLQFVKEHDVNTLVWVPSALCNVVNCHAFDVCVPLSVKLVIFCGEVMPCKYLNEWRRQIPEALYVNMYGPTEATYACMYYDIKKEFSDEDNLPLGKACENSEILLITDKGTCAERGEIGEICILGACLSQGYYNAWEKTREAFVQNPVNPSWMENIYRTGDLAYINEKGEMIFAGRKDFQIKRLGHRIELGEIESAIISHVEINSVCCLFKKSTSEIIVVYEGNISENNLATYITEKLPQYMLPNKYVQLEKMPMNLNGKIDRVKLKKEYVEE